MKIGSRLFMSFVVMQFLLIALAVLSINSMASMQQHIVRITNVNNVKSSHAAALRESVYERMIAMRNMALLTSMSDIMAETKRIAEEEKKYKAAMVGIRQLLEQKSDSGSEQDLLRRIEIEDARSGPITNRVIELARSNLSDQLFSILIGDLLPVQMRLTKALDDYARFVQEQNVAYTADANSSYEEARSVLIGLAVVSIILGTSVAWYTTRGILRQLGGEPNDAVEMARAIAAGQLADSDVVTTQSGKMMSVIPAMALMQAELYKIVSKLRTSVQTIEYASLKIARGNSQLSERNEIQLAALERSSMQVSQLAAFVKHNADIAGTANALSLTASDAARQGKQCVENVIDKMTMINGSAYKVVEIIARVDAIAMQTNLLAINASIEAARAREQGRGFAVVADQVRNLAQESADAAKAIKTLIHLAVIDIEKGMAAAGDAGRAMDGIVSSIREVTDLMAEIALASKTQAVDIETVSIAMNTVSDSMRRNAAEVENVAVSSGELSQQAVELNAMVDFFRIVRPHGDESAPLIN